MNENEAFEIAHADGESILLDMTTKISKIFDKNIAALKVRILLSERFLKLFSV